MKTIPDIVHDELVERAKFKKPNAYPLRGDFKPDLKLRATLETGDRIWIFSFVYKRWFFGIITNKAGGSDMLGVFSTEKLKVAREEAKAKGNHCADEGIVWSEAYQLAVPTNIYDHPYNG